MRESVGLAELEKEGEVALQVLGYEEIFLYVLVAAFAETGGDIGVRKQETNLVGGAFDGVGEKARVFVDDLGGNAADSGSDDRFLFPEGFGDGEAETFAEAFLDDDGGGALQCIDFERRPGREFEQLDVRVAFGGVLRFFQNGCPLGIVGCPAAREHQLAIKIATDNAIGADNADGIFEAVEAGDLREDGAEMVDAVPGEDIEYEFRREVAIFFRERVDGRVEKILRNGELLGEFG